MRIMSPPKFIMSISLIMRLIITLIVFQCKEPARKLGVASALATHGALYLAYHCTQGQQPRRSCAPSEEGFSGAPEKHRAYRMYGFIIA